MVKIHDIVEIRGFDQKNPMSIYEGKRGLITEIKKDSKVGIRVIVVSEDGDIISTGRQFVKLVSGAKI